MREPPSPRGRNACFARPATSFPRGRRRGSRSDNCSTQWGTGVARRDGTFEVVTSFLEKTLSGFGEIFRMLSYDDIGAGAIMSRATAGIARGKVVFAIPGSSGAVRLAMEKLILEEAGHIYWEITK